MKINLHIFKAEAATVDFKKGDRIIARISKNEWYTGTVTRSGKNISIRFDTGDTASVGPEDFKDIKKLNEPSIIFKTSIEDDVAKTLYKVYPDLKKQWTIIDSSMVGYKIVTKEYPDLNGIIITSDTKKLVSGRPAGSTGPATSIGKEPLINSINLGEIRLVKARTK